MISGLNHLTFAVSDLQTSLDFYCDVLGFKCDVIWENGAYLQAPGLWLCLSLDKTAPSTDYSHVAFSVAQDDFSILCEHITQSGVLIWKQNRSEGDSLYFCDPDGHKLEIHVGNREDRLNSLKNQPYAGLKWLS